MESQKLNVRDSKFTPLREVVFDTLRRMIVTGEFVPGERLMEIALAKRLGVSRTPVREAIHKLEQEGLVIMVPHCGAEVARITEKDLKDVLEVRRSLEELAVELAAERINDESRKEMIKGFQEFEASLRTKDNLKISDGDMTFHDAIFHAADNTRLLQIINNLQEQIYRYRLEYVKEEKSHSTMLQDHKNLLDAILEGNAAKAKQVIRKHIINQEQMILKNI